MQCDVHECKAAWGTDAHGNWVPDCQVLDFGLTGMHACWMRRFE